MPQRREDTQVTGGPPPAFIRRRSVATDTPATSENSKRLITRSSTSAWNPSWFRLGRACSRAECAVLEEMLATVLLVPASARARILMRFYDW